MPNPHRLFVLLFLRRSKPERVHGPFGYIVECYELSGYNSDSKIHSVLLLDSSCPCTNAEQLAYSRKIKKMKFIFFYICCPLAFTEFHRLGGNTSFHSSPTRISVDARRMLHRSIHILLFLFHHIRDTYL